MRIVKPVTGLISAIALAATSFAPTAQADQRGQRGEARGDRGDRFARAKVDGFLGGRDVRRPREPIPSSDPYRARDFGKKRGRGKGYGKGRGYDRGGYRGYRKGYRKGFRKGYRKGYSRPYFRAHRPYYKRYTPRRGYIAPRFRSPRYYAPKRYVAPRRFYRPVYRSFGHRYRVGHYYRYHPRTIIITDYRRYGLYDPPYGYHWVRDSDSGDVILASVATGAIIGLAVGLLSGY